MRKIIALLLTLSICLTACGTAQSSTSVSKKFTAENKIVRSAPSYAEEKKKSDTSAAEYEDTGVSTAADLTKYQKIEDQEIADQNMDLSDENLQRYLRDKIYTEAVDSFNSEEYCVDDVQTVYYSKEYIEQLSYNSQENIYFGFTQDELDKQFQGKKYVFTLDKGSGETTVTEVESYEDHTTEEVLKNVAIGSGVILVCVTVSAATGGAAPAVSMIFAASAKTGSIMALSGGAIGGICASLVKGYQTGSFKDAMNVAALGASDGFKWGAIMGALSGGASETWGLHRATANGLKMKEVAEIQRESKYPLDVIGQFKSRAEYEIYKNAGLRPQMVNGKLALVQDIDWNQTVKLPDGREVTNKWLVEHNYSPVDENGVAYELHHVNQDIDGTLAILTKQQHRGKGIPKILNRKGQEGVHNPEAGLSDAEWALQRNAFWKDYLKQCVAIKG